MNNKETIAKIRKLFDDINNDIDKEYFEKEMDKLLEALEQ